MDRVDWTEQHEEITGADKWFNPYDGELMADRIPGQKEGQSRSREEKVGLKIR